MIARIPHRKHWRLQALGLTLLLTLLAGSAQSLKPSAIEAEQAQAMTRCAASLASAEAVNGEPLSQELDVLSWNIQKAGSDRWAQDLATVGSGVQLAFIQEAATGAGIPQVLPAPLHRHFAAGYGTGALQTGVMTLSRSRPSLGCAFTAVEPWLRTPKAIGITEHPLQGRTERLLAINIHAINFAWGLDEYRAQFLALEQVLEAHRGPVILAGDFNTWSPAREQLVHRYLQKHGMQPVTFEPDLRTRAFGRALDHIYTRGLEALSAEVIEVSSSDHNPLRVRLGLAATPGS